jgi:hypothetical protein
MGKYYNLIIFLSKFIEIHFLFLRTVIHFNHPRTQASLTANTFAISGPGESKSVS